MDSTVAHDILHEISLWFVLISVIKTKESDNLLRRQRKTWTWYMSFEGEITFTTVKTKLRVCQLSLID